MAQSNQPLEWLFGEEQPPSSAWPPQIDHAPVDGAQEKTTDKSPQRIQKPHHLYELLIALTAIYGLAVALLWQQAERRLTQLEEQIDILRNELAQQETSPVAESNREDAAISHAVATLPHHLETTSLRFETTPELADLVQSVAARIDTAYRQLRQQFGLPPTAAAGKLTILIDPGAVYALRCGGEQCAEGHQHEKDVLTIPAPAKAAAIYGISEADALINEIAVRLSQRVLKEALQQQKPKPPWRAVTTGLHFYLAREIRNPDWQREEMYLRRRWLAQTQSLDLVYAPLITSSTPIVDSSVHPPIADELADPLIEFILETYGYGILPALLEGFSQYTTWESLAPAVFYMSAEELEASWHAYLAERYPIEQE